MKTNFRRLVALGLAAAVWHAGSLAALAAPGPERLKPAGDVSAVGQVLVDGAETLSGSTFFSGSEVLTGESARAVLSLGAEGRAELMSQSSLRLGFGEGQVTGTLGAGGVRFSKPPGVSASFTTADGIIVAGAEDTAVFKVRRDEGRTTVEAETGRVTFDGGGKVFRLEAGERYTAGQGGPGASNGLTTRQKTVIALGVGGLIVLLAIALTGGEDEESFGDEPCVIILSPTEGTPQC